MSTVVESPSPVKVNPDWNSQVKIGSGRSDAGAAHRAIAVAAGLFEAGKWNGRGLLVVHDAYETHRKAQFLGEELVVGLDYEFADDSVYQGAGPVEETPVDLPAHYPTPTDTLSAVLDYMDAPMLAGVAAAMVVDNVDNRSEWTEAIQEAYYLISRIGIAMIGEEAWDEMVAEGMPL